jgi:hypothetical protein
MMPRAGATDERSAFLSRKTREKGKKTLVFAPRARFLRVRNQT